MFVAKQEINVGAIEMSDQVLVRVKYFNSFNKQYLAIYLILYRGNFSQCSRAMIFIALQFFSITAVCSFFRTSSLKILQLADFDFFSLFTRLAVLMKDRVAFVV